MVPGNFFFEGEDAPHFGSKPDTIVFPDQRVAFSYHLNLFPYGGGDQVDGGSNVLTKKAQLEAYAFIEKRGLSLEVCRKFGVGLTVQEFPADVDTRGVDGVQVKVPWKKELCLSFPWMCARTDLTAAEREAYDKSAKRPSQDDVRAVILRTKIRALSTKGKQRVLPKGGGYGFFGWHLVSAEHTSIIITGG